MSTRWTVRRVGMVVAAMATCALVVISVIVDGKRVAAKEDRTQKHVQSQGREWVGRWADGTDLTREDLDRILEDHAQWLRERYTPHSHNSPRVVREVPRPRGALASLSDADLARVDLRRAKLRGAHLSGARLWGADLKDADLMNAKLIGTDFSNSNLSNADLSNAELSGAEFSGANLNGASFAWSDLTGARFSTADLSSVSFLGANLTGVYLDLANLTDARFEPDEIPSQVTDLLRVSGLSTMRYVMSPQALVRLRLVYREAGMRRQEREITCAINRTRFGGNGVGDWLNRILFDWTCAYGLRPHRPLTILAGLVVLFGCVYFFALCHGTTRSGIRVDARVNKRPRENSRYPILLAYHQRQELRFRSTPNQRLRRWWRAFAGFWRASRISFFFSVVSAARVGYRDVNIGKWIERMQSREYVLYGTGWVRTVAGVQALLSVYLLALWLLSYWSRPFDGT